MRVDQIKITVIIEVAICNPPAFMCGGEVVTDAFVDLGVATIDVFQRDGPLGNGCVGRIKTDVPIGYEEVFVTITIGVHKRGSPADVDALETE